MLDSLLHVYFYFNSQLLFFPLEYVQLYSTLSIKLDTKYIFFFIFKVKVNTASNTRLFWPPIFICLPIFSTEKGGKKG